VGIPGSESWRDMEVCRREVKEWGEEEEEEEEKEVVVVVAMEEEEGLHIRPPRTHSLRLFEALLLEREC
jgi:hypothetical protein